MSQHVGGDRFYFGSDSLSELAHSLVQPALLAVPEHAPAILTTTAGLAIRDTDSLDNGLAVGIDAPSQVTRIETTWAAASLVSVLTAGILVTAVIRSPP